jgi:hypothetical protein
MLQPFVRKTMNQRAIAWLQIEASELYRFARECEHAELKKKYQDRAAALSFAARVLAYIESPI